MIRNPILSLVVGYSITILEAYRMATRERARLIYVYTLYVWGNGVGGGSDTVVYDRDLPVLNIPYRHVPHV
jgi:hypothetical protein